MTTECCALHCVICFEEFSLRERPPVILPCGHTYVCLICSKRLKRCMECREPLFWTPPPSKTTPAAIMNNNNNNMNLNTRNQPVQQLRFPARRGYGVNAPILPNPNQPPIQQQEPIPFPLPKNLVLLEMIEAGERQARLLNEAKGLTTTTPSTSSSSSSVQRNESTGDGITSNNNNNGGGGGSSSDPRGGDDDGDDDDEKFDVTLARIVSVRGTCGTYAVRDPEGLAVLPFDPNRQHHDDTIKGEEEEKKIEEMREPFTIEAGSTVQVVAVEEGVYKLPRGVGFIVASANQLVKVGGPIDEACKLEGMLESVRSRQRALQRSLEKVNQLSNGIRDKMHLESSEPELYPVIAHPKIIEEETHPANDENEVSGGPPVMPEPMTPPKIKQDIGSFSTTDDRNLAQAAASGDDSSAHHHMGLGIHGVHRPRHTVGGNYENVITVHSQAHSCPVLSDTDTDHHQLDHPYMEGPSSGLPCYRINTEDDFHGITLGFGCGTSLFGERLIESHNIGEADSLMALSFDSFVDDAQTLGGVSSGATAISHPAMGVSGDSAAPETPLRSGSFDGVNFRTGMSGHRGLNQAKKKWSPSARRPLPMMSAHMGIGAPRTSRRVNSPAQHSPARYMPSPDRVHHPHDPNHRIHYENGVHLG